MRRLTLALVYSLLIDWALLGLAIFHVHNSWLGNLAYFLESLAYLWVLAGIGNRKPFRTFLIPALLAILLSTIWDAWHQGLWKKWLVTESTAGVVLCGFCLWLLLDLLRGRTLISNWNQASFWLLGAWTLQYPVEFTFYPIHNLFLNSLSRDWILVPWFAKYLIGLILNLGVARTYLCPKSSSS